MNPRASKITISPCVVCNYQFSDQHHVIPKRNGGTRTISLCPNHHRYANIIQNIMGEDAATGEQKVREFAKGNFDEEFNEKVLDELIAAYYNHGPTMADLIGKFGAE